MIKVPYTLKGEKYYPLLQLIIKKGNRMLKTEALVDSGASISVFQESIADYFDLEEQEKQHLGPIL